MADPCQTVPTRRETQSMHPSTYKDSNILIMYYNYNLIFPDNVFKYLEHIVWEGGYQITTRVCDSVNHPLRLPLSVSCFTPLHCLGSDKNFSHLHQIFFGCPPRQSLNGVLSHLHAPQFKTSQQDLPVLITKQTASSPYHSQSSVHSLTLWHPLLPYGYSYKASCARSG